MSYTPGPWIDGNSPAPCGCAQEREYTHPRPRYSTRTYRQRILYCPLHTAAPELVAAVKHAKRDAESRLYMLKVNADALERQIIEAQITIYTAALARVKGE